MSEEKYVAFKRDRAEVREWSFYISSDIDTRPVIFVIQAKYLETALNRLYAMFDAETRIRIHKIRRTHG